MKMLIHSRNRVMTMVLILLFSTALLSACTGNPAGGSEKQHTTTSSDLPVTATSDSLIDKAKQEGTVVVYTSKPRPISIKLAEMFEAKYPGIKVEIFQAGGSQVLSKVEAELNAGALKADVVDYTDGPAIIDQVNRGIIAKYIPENADKINEHLRDPNGYWVSSGGLVTATIAYNSNIISEKEAPKSWKDLTDPKWKGKISMASPDYAGTSIATIQGWVQEFGGEAYLKALGENNVRVLKSFGDTENSILSGEAPIGVVLSFRAYADLVDKKPIKIVEPSEGQFGMLTTVGINAKAAHPYAARLFENFIFSMEYQNFMVENHYYPARNDVQPANHIRPLSEIKLIWPDTEKLADPSHVANIKKAFNTHLKVH
ncbi:extracellular solute-binding protein [Bacillus sp. FJAT-49705]|uniref:Extracellular solute-binding protein n=1 Tax=Cytobacillus citreus TaxID=2833586 RepID=A0ABS5NZ69_9BACI|nr:extracellular solute-binding protein [Cytobacillus citreus]MBS4192378.1 extracellular solute-binding protein [Cytobacillus citreus]